MATKLAPAPSRGEAAPIIAFLSRVLQGKDLRRLTDTELENLIISPPSARAPNGSRFGDRTWYYPAEWYPHMPERAVCISFDFDGADAEGSQFVASIKRHVLSLALFPVNARPDLSSARQTCFMLKRIAAWLAKEGYIQFASLPRERLPELWQHLGQNWRAQSNWQILRKVLSNLNRQAERGFIQDVLPWADPMDPAATNGTTPSFHDDPSEIFDAPERPLTDQADNDGVWLPMGDAWLEAAGFRWNYLLKNILPNLIRLADDWATLNPSEPRRKRAWGGKLPQEQLSKSYLSDARREIRENYLRAFEWTDSEGMVMTELPFEIAGMRRMPVQWPELIRLMACTQKSLYCLLLLLTAGRKSEISTLKRSALLIEEITDDGYAHLHGRSFKFSSFGVGDEGAWPIPSSIGPFVENWSTMVGKLAGEGKTSLWITTGTHHFGSRPYFSPWPASLSRLFGLDDLAGEGNVHAHRFRKSMARLAVLCLVGAPLILQQILGHVDLATTLKYIFSDPYIRDELRDILEEIRLDIAVSIAEATDDVGGRGANTIRRARDDFMDKLEVPENERAQRYSARDFAVAHLADGGFDLKIVFAGIICIKPPEVPGRCSQFGLKPDTSRCQADCMHFVALPSAKASTRVTLEWLLAELQDSEIVGSPLLEPFYRAQFVDQARIFEDLRVEYAVDPRVKELLPPDALRILGQSLRS